MFVNQPFANPPLTSHTFASHWDGWNTMEGRHLVFAYALVLLLQLGYVTWIAITWLRLDAARRQGVERKKAAKPA